LVLSGNPITQVERHDQATTIHGPIYFEIREFSKIQAIPPKIRERPQVVLQDAGHEAIIL
jgi:hypothetical protein